MDREIDRKTDRQIVEQTFTHKDSGSEEKNLKRSFEEQKMKRTTTKQ